jgi:hypothetical protein
MDCPFSEKTMTDFPITPPPELVQQWINEEDGLTAGHIATQAARWGADQQLKLDAEQIAQAYQAGADQELDACCNYFEDHLRDGIAKDLRAARRPKPPSLKEQALIELGDVYNRDKIEDFTYDTIRRALEALDD